MNFRIQKQKKKVELHLAGRSPMLGYVFLGEVATEHHSAERVMDILVSEELFFPFESENSEFWMIRKGSVKEIVTDSAYELEVVRSYGQDAFQKIAVKFLFLDGTEVKGELLVEPREGAARASDEINRSRGFVRVESGEQVHIIGIQQTSVVQELK